MSVFKRNNGAELHLTEIDLKLNLGKHLTAIKFEMIKDFQSIIQMYYLGASNETLSKIEAECTKIIETTFIVEDSEIDAMIGAPNGQGGRRQSRTHHPDMIRVRSYLISKWEAIAKDLIGQLVNYLVNREIKPVILLKQSNKMDKLEMNKMWESLIKLEILSSWYQFANHPNLIILLNYCQTHKSLDKRMINPYMECMAKIMRAFDYVSLIPKNAIDNSQEIGVITAMSDELTWKLQRNITAEKQILRNKYFSLISEGLRNSNDNNGSNKSINDEKTQGITELQNYKIAKMVDDYANQNDINRVLAEIVSIKHHLAGSNTVGVGGASPRGLNFKQTSVGGSGASGGHDGAVFMPPLSKFAGGAASVSQIVRPISASSLPPFAANFSARSFAGPGPGWENLKRAGSNAVEDKLSRRYYGEMYESVFREKVIKAANKAFHRLGSNHSDSNITAQFPGLSEEKKSDLTVSNAVSAPIVKDLYEQFAERVLTIGNNCEKKLIQYARNDYYGQFEAFPSPFRRIKKDINGKYSKFIGNSGKNGKNNGKKHSDRTPVLYCDWTASGKCLKCVEYYINSEVLTLYANTHTTTSITGKQTSIFRNEARALIMNSIQGDVSQDVILFCGNGVTGAINKLAGILMKTAYYAPETTVVFIGVYEHNSNIYIWQELGIKVIVIPEAPWPPKQQSANSANSSDKSGLSGDSGHRRKGGIDMELLEKYLIEYSANESYNLLIGSFSAASNISGIIEKHEEITALLHKYNALSFWDFATAGPYLDINMTNKDDNILSKDAVFISPHKFLGGPGSPGILCVKRNLCNNLIPVVPSGGTVYFAYGVEKDKYEYLSNIEEREEGGTPNILGSIRAALAFMMKDAISTKYICSIEDYYIDKFFEEFDSDKHQSNKCMEWIGNTKCARLPIVSFNIKFTNNREYEKYYRFGSKKDGDVADGVAGPGCNSGICRILTNGCIRSETSETKYLHYNFIAALLNDLFGIQGRGGCSCAGMYGAYAMEVGDVAGVKHVLDQLHYNSNELALFGYYRVNFHFTMTLNEFNYVLKCVRFIAEYGWVFVPLYRANKETGGFVHRWQNESIYRSMLDIQFDSGNMIFPTKHEKLELDEKSKHSEIKEIDFEYYLERANYIKDNIKDYLPSKEELLKEDDIVDERPWYWLPIELWNQVRVEVAGLDPVKLD